MSKFENAIAIVLENEGRLNVDPKDRGGITNFGISLRFLRELPEEKLRRYGIFEEVTEETIRLLTEEQAKFIYRGEFWEPNHFELLDDQIVCNYIFDMACNLGIGQAIRLVQRAICASTFTRDYIREDGVLGPKTRSAINTLNGELLPILVGLRADYYRNLAYHVPDSYKNLDGWLNRAYAAL